MKDKPKKTGTRTGSVKAPAKKKEGMSLEETIKRIVRVKPKADKKQGKKQK